MLKARDVPDDLPYLARTWHRVEDFNDAPHYQSIDEPRVDIFWHNGWFIADPDVPNVLMYAASDSLALHPNTILPGEWYALTTWPSTWTHLDAFHVSVDAPRDAVLSMDEIGRDYFVRAPQRDPIFFRRPDTGEIAHSGTKGGFQYCHLCDRCLSAHNFKAQHLRKKHS